MNIAVHIAALATSLHTALQSQRECTMPLADELQRAAVQAQAAAAKQGDTVRSLKASLKDGKVEKVRRNALSMYGLCIEMLR